MFVNKIGQHLTMTEMQDIENALAYHGQDFKEAQYSQTSYYSYVGRSTLLQAALWFQQTYLKNDILRGFVNTTPFPGLREARRKNDFQECLMDSSFKQERKLFTMDCRVGQML